MSTLTPSSPPAAWICFQIINGIARGLITQVPVTAVQVALNDSELAIGTAFVTVVMSLGAALFVSLGETTVLNALRPALRKLAPTVDAQKVISAGATAFRSVISEGEVVGVVKAYNQAITTTFVS